MLRNKPSTRLLTLSLFALMVPRFALARLLPPLNEDDFRRISFVGRCAQNQWATNRDHTLEMMMSAESGESCEARLHFRTPQDLKTLAGLQFKVRSSRPKQRMTIELVSSSEGEMEDSLARTRPFTVSDEWTRDALRFQRVRNAGQLKDITEIRFITYSETGHTAPSLFISGIRFFEFPKRAAGAATEATPEAAAAATVPPAAADIPLEHQMVCVSANELSSLQPPGSRVSTMGLVADLKALAQALIERAIEMSQAQKRGAEVGLVWLLTALWLVRRKKPSIVTLISPLNEINTRTWKSTRDADGVHHLGGFNAITAGDLKAIKAGGFNGIWLMGIWDVGPKVRAISKRYGPDFQGSPFAIRDYRVSEDLGSEKDFDALVERAHAAGLKVILDFVPNHMGIDSDWLNCHPEFFIHRVVSSSEMSLSDSELEKRHPGYFVHRTPSYPQGHRRVPKTIMVAYGKDPYFYPWIDTAQLDYAEPALRRKMTEVLCELTRKVDGVRCDMAMLVLREQVKIHRHPEMSWEAFNRLMPEEFWPDAIRAAKRVNPLFTFMAETYWSMEGYLQQLGFDYTYNKPLYEAIVSAFHSANAEGLLNFMRLLGNDFLSRGIHFIENHDEERAMNTLGEDRQRAAAAVLCTLPGVALLHQGQTEGKRERLPVQRAVPIHQEPVNNAMKAFYEGLMKATSKALFREGRLNVLYSNNPSLISYARVNETEKALVIVNTSAQLQKGTITVVPGLNLKSGVSYGLRDLFYDLKSPDIRNKDTVKVRYSYTAAHLINDGLYVELAPFDAHIFLVEPDRRSNLSERAKHALRLVSPAPKLRVPARSGLSHFWRSSGGGE